jgi:peptidoglycan-associated lipoprotein
MKNFLILLIASVAATSGTLSHAQAPSLFQQRPEVGIAFTYAHGNAPPADCNCFSLVGGSVSVAQPLRDGRFALALDATFDHASHLYSGDYDLTLAVFTGGVRYRPLLKPRWNPYGEVLVGVTHGYGSLLAGNTPAATDPSLLFASNVGGGLDYTLSPHWAVRLVEADYLLTTFSNRVNDHQNNLRISTGLSYRFGKR